MPDFPNDDTQLDASERVRIASAGHTAEFAPAAGGRLTGLSTDGLDWIVPLAETDWPAAKWPRAGSYPLAPYSNRIRDGVFTFDGARHRLRSLAGRSEAIHGSGLYLPWQVRALEADRSTGAGRAAGTMGWALAVRMRAALSAGCRRPEPDTDHAQWRRYAHALRLRHPSVLHGAARGAACAPAVAGR